MVVVDGGQCGAPRRQPRHGQPGFKRDGLFFYEVNVEVDVPSRRETS